MSFADKVVLITGASAGIGAEIAVHLAKADADLALVGRNAAKFDKVIERISETGSTKTPLLILADVSKDAECIIGETIERYGKIDVLINNAGIGGHGDLENLNLEDYDAIMNTNVRAAIQLAHLATPYLIESKGNILNISSGLAIRPIAGEVAYCVSKAAIDQFTKCAALELSPKGVRVNSVNPGYIDTEFHNDEFPGQDLNAINEMFSKLMPIRRIGVPDDIAKAVTFICNNDLASFITGISLVVDGGFTIAQPS